jgi:hypothetical protein
MARPLEVTKENAEKLLTAGGLAERIRPIAARDDVAALIERIRNWVKAGLLRPVAGYGEGKGHHAQFSEDAVYEAAVLCRALDANLSVQNTREMIVAVTAGKFSIAEWKRARARGQKLARSLLIISFAPGGRMHFQVVDRRAQSLPPDVLTWIVFDLDAIWSLVADDD